MTFDTSILQEQVKAFEQAEASVKSTIKALVTDQTQPLEERWQLFSDYSKFGTVFVGIPNRFDVFSAPKWQIKEDRGSYEYIDKVDPIEDLTSDLENGSEADLIYLISYHFEYPDVEKSMYNTRECTRVQVTQEDLDNLKEELMSKMIVGFRRSW